MGFFDFFKKKTRELRVGEIDGDNIGCYVLLLVNSMGEVESHLSLATNRDQLIKDCKEFLNDIYESKKEKVKSLSGTENPDVSLNIVDLMSADFLQRHKNDLEEINHLRSNIENLINEGASGKLFSLLGRTVYLKTGVRKRQKIRGNYIE